MIQGTAKRKFYLEAWISEKELVEQTEEFAQSYRGYGLDSLDLGDTMGFWMEYLSENPGTAEVLREDKFRVWFEDDTFVWIGRDLSTPL